MTTVKHILLVGLGGAIGSILRYSFSVLIKSNLFPLSTLLVNIFGSMVMGIVMAYTLKEPVTISAKLFIATGICGGFTTFSAFAYENFSLLQAGKYEIAFFYIFLSVALSVLATWAGFKLFI